MKRTSRRRKANSEAGGRPASTRIRPWGFSWRLLLGFILVISVTVLSFSFLLLGRLESYLLHDMENSLANQAIMARGPIEFALAQAHVNSLSSLDEAARKSLEHLAVGLGSQTSCRILFTDRSGKRVIDSAYWTKPGSRFGGFEEMREALATGYGADTRHDSITGKFTMYVAYPIHSLDGRTIGIMRLSKGVGSVSSLLGTIQGRIALAGLVAAAVAAVVSVGMAFTLARPLRKIQDAATRFGRGDLSARSQLKGSSEMAELSRSFDRMADRIEKTVGELAELDDMKSQFVANVSHELRTPLTAIRGLAETLLDGALDDEDVNRRFVGDILSESERLLLMVNNVLNLARIEAGVEEVHPEQVDVLTLTATMVDRMVPLAERAGIELVLAASSSSADATVDVLQTQQALANVVDNAIKFSQKGSAVRVSVKSSERQELAGATIIVEDSGRGIEPVELERVFERFHRTGGGEQGAGLGLAIAHHAVDSSGGHISLESEPGKGTTVTIWLPA
ncbi:MAG TPA: HAMP domain-containing sensor histidine kinase [Candidatus Anoxymicrobiaceae bacterium]